MVVAPEIKFLLNINDCKVSLDGPSVFVLKYFQPLIFKPVLNGPVLMNRNPGQVCFARFHFPVYAILRTLINSNAAKPVIYDEVVLDTVAPNNRIFKITRSLWISSYRYNLVAFINPRSRNLIIS